MTLSYEPPYKSLGDALLRKLGDRSLGWLAQQALVTCQSAHLWLTGECRPRVQRLGYIAAILEFDREDIPTLADWAGYPSPVEQERMLQAYLEWQEVRQRWPLEQVTSNVRLIIADKIITLLRTDGEFRQTAGQVAPDLVALVSQSPT